MLKRIKKILSIKTILLITGCFLFAPVSGALSNDDKPQTSNADTISKVLTRVEARYSSGGFTAVFQQKSTLEAMEITDTASGKVMFKNPGMMRWEYEQPEQQQIITDGDKLWIYRPDDKQTIIGKAKAYFGSGSGASFLTDIKNVKREFTISLEKDNSQSWTLLLKPIRENPQLAKIYLSISKANAAVSRVKTINAYGDDTLIVFSQIKFHDTMENSPFKFKVPENCEIMYLDDREENQTNENKN